MTNSNSKVDLDRLLKLRMVVARYGEMDSARWWNTSGLLGPKGALLMSRGFPRTHIFAQAGVVLAVARNRCEDVFQHPGATTIWSLPAELEDQFDSRWGRWLEDIDHWREFFTALETPPPDLLSALRQLRLISPDQEAVLSGLRRSAEGRAVLLARRDVLDDELIILLAAAFSLGEHARPAIPYVLLGGSGG